jgi:DNA repair protein RecN (Recombination protein N)
MIDEIHLHDVALIHDAALAPADGLTVVTGESGSGKSALLSGIKLLVGERGGADMVREGADKLVVEGRFFYEGSERTDESDTAAAPSAVDRAAASEDGLVVRRSVSAAGRSRVQVDGAMGTVRDLINGPGTHVDLCGQHEHQRLLKPAQQAAMLDAWIGDEAHKAKASYRAAFRAHEDAVRERDRIQELGREDTARVEDARFVLRTIDAVDPKEGEYEDLLAQAERAEHAEAIAQGLAGASQALSGDAGALEQVDSAAGVLEQIAPFDERYRNLAQAIREAGYLLEDAARDVSSLRDDDEAFDADALEQLQERVAAFQGLRRNYGPTMQEVFATRDRAAEVVAAVDGHDEQLAAAEKAVADTETALVQAAHAFHEVRARAAGAFAQQVGACLAELEMGSTEIVCRVDLRSREQWTNDAPDEVEFLFRPGPGMSTRPLRRIASGGEISRVMLAVKVALGQADGVDTLVFDEVDAGIGGKTARAVAVVLKRLAQSHQVICVTHLPQIAVAGDRHYRVRKVADASDGVPATELERLEGSARIDEIARMLSGDTSEASRAHAAELLEEAKGFVD